MEECNVLNKNTYVVVLKKKIYCDNFTIKPGTVLCVNNVKSSSLDYSKVYVEFESNFCNNCNNCITYKSRWIHKSDIRIATKKECLLYFLYGPITV